MRVTAAAIVVESGRRLVLPFCEAGVWGCREDGSLVHARDDSRFVRDSRVRTI